MKIISVALLCIVIAGCNNGAPILVNSARPAITLPKMPEDPAKNITLHNTPSEKAKALVASRHLADHQIQILNLIVSKCTDVQKD